MIHVIISYQYEQGKLEFNYQCESEEPKESSAKMSRSKFFVELPIDVSIESIHPDHLALCAFLVIRPWVNKKLTFSIPISQRFADGLKKCNFVVGPVDENLKPYFPKGDLSYMGLAYSGGADSTAALSVLPKTTIPIFLDRPKMENTLYSKEAAILSCESLKKVGYQCLLIKCNLESMREPLGFPTDLSNGVPAILLATKLNLFAISYGTVLESMYGLGRLKFKDYEETSHKRMWWNVFESAGLPLTFPIAGVSEVGTELICSRSDIGSIARSCIRGTASNPCYKCWKCFRKLTLKKSLDLGDDDDEHFIDLISNKEVRTKLSKMPISHENVLLYAFSKLEMSIYPPGFSNRFSHNLDLDYLEKWYSPSKAYIDSKIRFEVISNLNQYLSPMQEREEKLVKEWDNQARIEKLIPLEYD